MRISVTPVSWIAGKDRGRDGRRAPMPRQERWVEVQRAVPGQVEQRGRHQPSVVGEDEQVGHERADRVHGSRARSRAGVRIGRPRAAAHAPTGEVQRAAPAGRARWGRDDGHQVDVGCVGRAPGGSGRRMRRCRGRPSGQARSRQCRQHLCFGVRLDLVLQPGHRDQLVHRLEVVDVQLAVEMVELVLERARQEPVPASLILRPRRFWATTQTFSRRVT